MKCILNWCKTSYMQNGVLVAISTLNFVLHVCKTNSGHILKKMCQKQNQLNITSTFCSVAPESFTSNRTTFPSRTMKTVIFYFKNFISQSLFKTLYSMLKHYFYHDLLYIYGNYSIHSTLFEIIWFFSKNFAPLHLYNRWYSLEQVTFLS